ncbi:hypothetical protein ZIOFF_067447 [Zingiber officinale]|uniref:Uncharacterized protein n=1 Tax=Zingiber officinale TaxID=94328 RepID=A0A8J5C5S6_ZINOF|nr:hypothetical protein ZIOFF_067447 [Zingiber officinale]
MCLKSVFNHDAIKQYHDVVDDVVHLLSQRHLDGVAGNHEADEERTGDGVDAYRFHQHPNEHHEAEEADVEVADQLAFGDPLPLPAHHDTNEAKAHEGKLRDGDLERQQRVGLREVEMILQALEYETGLHGRMSDGKSLGIEALLNPLTILEVRHFHAFWLNFDLAFLQNTGRSWTSSLFQLQENFRLMLGRVGLPKWYQEETRDYVISLTKTWRSMWV